MLMKILTIKENVEEVIKRNPLWKQHSEQLEKLIRSSDTIGNGYKHINIIGKGSYWFPIWMFFSITIEANKVEEYIKEGFVFKDE